jgi:hypothetical protein
MGINREKYLQAAKRSDVGTVAIKVSIALEAIHRCLGAIAEGKPPDANQLTKIKEMADKIEADFDALSGWTPDG